MYDGMRAVGNVAALYYIGLIVAGNFMVLNLFVAVLLASFGDRPELEE